MFLDHSEATVRGIRADLLRIISTTDTYMGIFIAFAKLYGTHTE